MSIKIPWININTARTDKMKEFLRLGSIISMPVAVGWLGCDTPSEPVEVGLFVTPLDIFSAVLEKKNEISLG